MADLRGKKLAIGAFGGCEWNGWYPYAKAVEGIDLAKEAQVVTAGYLASPELLARGEVDAAISAPVFGINKFVLEGKVRALYRGDSLQGVYFRRTGHLGPACTTLMMYKQDFEKMPHVAEMLVGMFNEGLQRFLSDVPGYIQKYPKVWPESILKNPRELEMLIEWLRDPIGGSLYRDITLDEKWIQEELEFIELQREAGIIEKGTQPPDFEVIKPGRKP